MPRAIGRRIDAAGLANTAAGRVSEGMKVVMFAGSKVVALQTVVSVRDM